MESRSKNAKRNTIWGMLNRIFGLLLPFATRTVIIRTLGSEYLGLSGLFTSILTVLNLTELGVGSAIVYSMYKPLAENDTELVCALLNFYKKIYKIIGIIIIALGVIITPLVPHLIHSAIPSGVNLFLLYYLYLINTGISYFLFAYKTSLLHATQRNDIISKTSLVVTIILNITQIVLLLAYRNYYYFIITQICSTICINLVNSYTSRVLYPQYVCKGNLSANYKNEIKNKVTGLMMIKIAAISRNALDNIIISSFFGLTTVAIYDNYYYVISAVSSLLLVLMSSISASVGNSIATETKEKNLDDMRIMNFLFLSISGVCASCMTAVFQDFITIWAGKKLVFSFSMMLLFVLYFILMKIGDVQAQYFDAAGLWWHGRMRGFIEAGCNLLLNILLGYILGPLGVLIATIITIAFINFPLSTYYTFKYYFEKSPSAFVLEQIRTVASIIISCGPAALMTFFISNPLDRGYLPFLSIAIVKAVLSVAAFLVLYYMINRNNYVANKAIIWIKRIVNA